MIRRSSRLLRTRRIDRRNIAKYRGQSHSALPNSPLVPSAPQAGYFAQPGIPVGAVIAFAGEIRQSQSDTENHKTNLFMFNWLLCDGSSVAIAEYPELYAALGGLYGGSESSGSFTLPNYQGTFLRGVDQSNQHAGSCESRSASASGSTNGVGSTQDYAIKTHEHNYLYKTSGSITPADPPGATFLASMDQTKETTGLTNANTSSSESRPVNTFVYWLIKARSDAI